MKILCLSVGDNGGGCYWTADAINKYTEHEARAVRFVQSWIGYPYDIFAPSKPELVELIKWADVLHIRDNISEKWPPISNKPAVITWTGMSYRQRASAKLQMCKERGIYATVSTPDLVSLTPDNSPDWLPNPREEMSLAVKSKRIIACHAPTFRERKGTAQAIEACQKVGVQLELIEELPFWKALKKKQACNLVLDQLGAYGYGNNAIEAWAMGQPVISGASRPAFVRHIKSIYGGLPFCECGADVTEIVKALEVMKNKSVRDKWVEIGRDFFFEYHHAPVVARRAIEIYKKVL